MECYTAVGLINWLNYFYVEIFFATDYRKRFLLKLAVFFQCSVFNRATRMHIWRGLSCGKMYVPLSVPLSVVCLSLAHAGMLSKRL